MDDAQLARELAKAEKEYRAATETQEAAATRRNELVWQAVDQGWTYVEIAEESGLSRQRVGQIAKLSDRYKPRGRADRHTKK